MKKKIASILALLALILTIPSIVYANTTDSGFIEIDLETSNYNYLKQSIDALLSHIFKGEKNEIRQYYSMMTQSTYDKLKKITEDNYLQSQDGFSGFNSITIDRIYPDTSTTGDTVLMVNTIAQYSRGYSQAYLFEFHVNADKKIYGYNIWVY